MQEYRSSNTAQDIKSPLRSIVESRRSSVESDSSSEDGAVEVILLDMPSPASKRFSLRRRAPITPLPKPITANPADEDAPDSKEMFKGLGASTRALLGSRKRFRPAATKPAIKVGVIVGDSSMHEAVSIDERDPFADCIDRTIVRQAYKCISTFFTPIRLLYKKSEKATLVRAKGRLA